MKRIRKLGIVTPLLAAAIVWVEWGALRAQAQTTEEADAFECSTEKFAGTYAFRRVVDGQGEPGVFSGSVGIMVIDAQGNATSLLTWTVTPDEIFSLDVADFLDIPSRLEANCTGSQQFVENGGAKLDHRAANRSCFWAE